MTQQAPGSDLARHPELPSLARAVLERALAAARARDATFLQPGSTAAAPELSREQAETPLGNVVDLLTTGATTPELRRLAGQLAAFGLRGGDAAEVAGELVWLAAATPCDALAWLDEALGAEAGPAWTAVAGIVAQAAAHPRAESVVAAAALGASRAEPARRLADELAGRSDDPLLQRLLAGPAAAALRGELEPPPRNVALTLLLAATGVLLLTHGARLLGRAALAYRRPASLALGPGGLELRWRTELLGRTLRERELVVPLANLARVTREVRYARAGTYAGLVALALGSYFGVGMLVDGARVPGGSLQLLAFGLLLVALGLALDWLLSSFGDSVRGRCRIVVVPRKGPTLCIAALDAARADATMAAFVARAH
jgi:hypothetical protein